MGVVNIANNNSTALGRLGSTFSLGRPGGSSSLDLGWPGDSLLLGSRGFLALGGVAVGALGRMEGVDGIESGSSISFLFSIFIVSPAVEESVGCELKCQQLSSKLGGSLPTGLAHVTTKSKIRSLPERTHSCLEGSRRTWPY